MALLHSKVMKKRYATNNFTIRIGLNAAYQ
jgi:hypothetical protein